MFHPLHQCLQQQPLPQPLLSAPLPQPLHNALCIYGATAQALAPRLPTLQPFCLTMSVRCPDCHQSFKSKRSLSNHQYKYTGTCFVEMSNAEYDLLSPEPGNQMEVWCNTCDKSIAKRSIFKHLQDHHPELEAGSWGDYNLLKRIRSQMNIHPSTLLGLERQPEIHPALLWQMPGKLTKGI